MAKNLKRTILSEKMPNNKHIIWALPQDEKINLKIFNNGLWRLASSGGNESSDNYYNINADTTYENLKSFWDNNPNDSIKVFSDENGLGTLTYKHLSEEGIEQNVFSILYENGNAEFFAFNGDEYFHNIILSRQRYIFTSTGTITYEGNVGQGDISQIYDTFTGEIADLYTIHGKTSILMSGDGSFFYLTWGMPLDTNISEFGRGTAVSTWIGSTATRPIIYTIRTDADSMVE